MRGGRITQRIKGLPPAAYMLVIPIVIFSVMSPSYLTLMNFKSVPIQVTSLMIVAFRQTCIVLTQGTNLSLGAQVSFITAFIVWMALRRILLPTAMLFAISSTTLIGVVNDMIVVKESIPPLIVTYGMQNTLNSLSLLLAADSSTYFQSFIYRIITEAIILGIPLMVWAAILVFIMVWMVLNRTRSETNTHGLSSNREALQLVDINPVIYLIRTCAFAGFVAGTAGVIALSRIEADMPTAATGWEFRAVAVTLLGKTFLHEGEDGTTGTVFGVLLIRVIRDGLDIVGVQSVKQNAITGSIVLVAIIIGAITRTRSKE